MAVVQRRFAGLLQTAAYSGVALQAAISTHAPVIYNVCSMELAVTAITARAHANFALVTSKSEPEVSMLAVPLIRKGSLGSPYAIKNPRKLDPLLNPQSLDFRSLRLSTTHPANIAR